MSDETRVKSAAVSTVIDSRNALVAECVEWRRANAVPKHFITPLPANASPEVVERTVNQDAHKIFGAAMLLKKAGVQNILSWLSRVYYVNGAPSVWGELPLFLAQQQPDFDHSVFETYEIDFDGKRIGVDAGFDEKLPWAVVCVLGRKNSKPQHTRWTLMDVYQAGHLALGQSSVVAKQAAPTAGARAQFERAKFVGGVWSSYGRRMMQLRAIALALRAVYPGLLDGVSVMEYDLDTMPTADRQTAKKINAAGTQYVYLKSLSKGSVS